MTAQAEREIEVLLRVSQLSKRRIQFPPKDRNQHYPMVTDESLLTDKQLEVIRKRIFELLNLKDNGK